MPTENPGVQSPGFSATLERWYAPDKQDHTSSVTGHRWTGNPVVFLIAASVAGVFNRVLIFPWSSR